MNSITLTGFAKRTKDGKPKNPETLTLDQAGLDAIQARIENMRDTGKCQFLTFTTYSDSHTRDNIQQCSAVMLEYPYSKRQQLDRALNSLPYTYMKIDTQSDFSNAAEARILVAFPTLQAITDTREYTRVASLLWDEIGIEATTQGSVSSTFLFAPYVVNPRAVLCDADRILLDHDAYLAANRGEWVKVNETDKPVAPLQVGDDDLFAWGTA